MSYNDNNKSEASPLIEKVSAAQNSCFCSVFTFSIFLVNLINKATLMSLNHSIFNCILSFYTCDDILLGTSV